MDVLHNAANRFHYPSLLGDLEVEFSSAGIHRIDFVEATMAEPFPAACPWLGAVVQELEEYFAGKRRSFSFPLAPTGTLFRQRVWQVLQEIPYGKTVSYTEVAERIGRPKAYRAVGQAIHHNPLAIIIPCHRVVGKNGSLTGYAGGLWRKKKLLELEQAT